MIAFLSSSETEWTGSKSSDFVRFFPERRGFSAWRGAPVSQVPEVGEGLVRAIDIQSLCFLVRRVWDHR
jgi:hypothetical protein